MSRFGVAILVGLLATLLVVAAFAQDDDPKQEKKQLQLRLQKFNESPGSDAHGGIERRGSEFAGEGGPHGPFGPGPDDPEEKDSIQFFSEGIEDTPTGQMLQHSWGPGDSSMEPPCGSFGPNFDGDCWGPGGDSSGAGGPEDGVGSRSQSRSGRG